MRPSYRPHYASCPSVCLTVCLSICTGSWLENKKVENSKLVQTFPRLRVSGVPIKKVKGQGHWTSKTSTAVNVRIFLANNQKYRLVPIGRRCDGRPRNMSALGGDVFSCNGLVGTVLVCCTVGEAASEKGAGNEENGGGQTGTGTGKVS